MTSGTTLSHHICIISSQKKRENRSEKRLEEITAENFPNIPNMGKEIVIQVQVQEVESPIEDKPKEECAKTH